MSEVNGTNQLGDGTTTNRNVPVSISGLAGVAAIEGGDDQSLAVKSDGSAWGWSYNGNGELGDGTKTNRSAPVQVSGLTGVLAIASGDYHSLAIAGNWKPVANDDSYSTDQDIPLLVAAPVVLANDTDANNDPLTAALLDDVTSGALTLNADGSFSYTPQVSFNGEDSFTYEANDRTTTSTPATVTITVNAPLVLVPGVSVAGLVTMAGLLLLAYFWGYRRNGQDLGYPA